MIIVFIRGVIITCLWLWEIILEQNNKIVMVGHQIEKGEVNN